MKVKEKARLCLKFRLPQPNTKAEGAGWNKEGHFSAWIYVFLYGISKI